jgi:hypothetical protein
MEMAAPARRAEEPPAGLEADRLLDRLMMVGWPPTSRGTHRRCSSCRARPPPPPRRRCGSKTTQTPVRPIRRPRADIRGYCHLDTGSAKSAVHPRNAARVPLLGHSSCETVAVVAAVLTRTRKLLIGLEAPPGFEPGMEVLQTSALPLGDGAGWNSVREGKESPARVYTQGQQRARQPVRCIITERKLERETGFEPATSTLARSHSTTELFPPATKA